MLFLIYCIIMFCVGLQIFLCFMHSWNENVAKDDTEKGTHTMQTDRETVWEEGHIASPRNIYFFFPQPVREMKRWVGKRDGGGWRLHAVTHQQKGQRGGPCHIASESAAATPALRAYTLLLGEQSRGEQRRGQLEHKARKKRTSPSVLFLH